MTIVKRELKHNAELIRRVEAACIVAFAACSTLPANIAKEVAAFIKHPFTERTIKQISMLICCEKRQEIIMYGRGGEGLCSTEKYHIKHQLPQLLFSQYNFRREILKQAHLSLYRRLTLRGTLDEQLSTLFLILLNEL